MVVFTIKIRKKEYICICIYVYCNPVEVLAFCFSWINKLIAKFTWIHKISRFVKILPKNKVNGFTVPDFKTHYKVTLIKIVCFGGRTDIFTEEKWQRTKGTEQKSLVIGLQKCNQFL